MSPEPGSERPTKSSCGFSLRILRRLGIRLFKVFAMVTLALLVYVLMYVEFPTESIIYGKGYNTSDLSRLQGHDQYIDETSHTPEIIGHRGLAFQSDGDDRHPIENTEAAIRAAAKADVDRIEIDVRMTGEDEQLFLYHDSTFSSKVDTTSKETKEKSFRDSTWGEVSQVTLKGDSDDKHIPTLTEGLEAAYEVEGYDPQWVLDIKLEKDETHRDRMKQKLLGELFPSSSKSRLNPSNVTILGDHDTLHFLYREGEERLSREYPCGMIVRLSEKNALRFLLNPSQWITDGQQISADILVLPLIFVTEPLIAEAKSAGLKVWVWNCNQPTDQNRLKHYEVDGLIVDHLPE